MRIQLFRTEGAGGSEFRDVDPIYSKDVRTWGRADAEFQL